MSASWMTGSQKARFIKKTIVGITAVYIWVLFPSYVYADGNELLRQCQTAVNMSDMPNTSTSDTDLVDAGYCLGYLSGFVSSHAMHPGSKKDGVNSPLFCLPSEGLKTIQMARMTVKYLKSHPNELHFSDRVLVAAMFATSFPCNR